MATKTEFRKLDHGYLGDRAGACHVGWPHEYAPDECELDSILEEHLLEMTMDHEEISKTRQHSHHGVPSKWDLLRAHASVTPHPLHGAALKPVTRGVVEATPPEVQTAVKPEVK